MEKEIINWRFHKTFKYYSGNRLLGKDYRKSFISPETLDEIKEWGMSK